MPQFMLPSVKLGEAGIGQQPMTMQTSYWPAQPGEKETSQWKGRLDTEPSKLQKLIIYLN